VGNTSVFIFSCLCGRQFQKEEKGVFRCPDCGRLLIVEWGAEAAEMAVSSEDTEHAYATNR
jgi:Zn finger protein HypA/HybF involved in hydrogenase expression